MRIYYNGWKAATRMSSKSQASTIHGGEDIVALYQLQEGEQSTDLLAIDSQKTLTNKISKNESLQANFTPYGHLVSTAEAPVAFKGEYRMPATGNYLLGNGYRSYNPILMRFQSPDSESPFGAGGINTYCFVLGDPVNGSDPSGHFPFFTTHRNFKGIPLDIKNFSPWAYYAKDPTNKKQTILTIAGHGAPGAMANGSSQYPIDAKQLFEIFERSNYSLKNRKIHLITCYSATPLNKGEDSFARSLSRLTQAPVIGYRASVSTNRERFINNNVHIRVLERATFFENLKGHRSAKNIRVVEDIRNTAGTG